MKKVTIDCKRNDDVDIRAGGPEYLGFDFYVDDYPDEEIKDFIEKSLKRNGHDCISIKITSYRIPKIWTSKEIDECIKNTRF